MRQAKPPRDARARLSQPAAVGQPRAGRPQVHQTAPRARVGRARRSSTDARRTGPVPPPWPRIRGMCPDSGQLRATTGRRTLQCAPVHVKRGVEQATRARPRRWAAQWARPRFAKLRLAFTERCDSGYRFPIGIPIYIFRTDVSVCLVSYLIQFLGCVVGAPLAFAPSLTDHHMTRPYQLLASALHPTSATTATVPNLG